MNRFASRDPATTAVGDVGDAELLGERDGRLHQGPADAVPAELGEHVRGHRLDHRLEVERGDGGGPQVHRAGQLAVVLRDDDPLVVQAAGPAR